MRQVVVNVDEADLRRVEQTLAEEEAKLVSVTDRKTRAGEDKRIKVLLPQMSLTVFLPSYEKLTLKIWIFKYINWTSAIKLFVKLNELVHIKFTSLT